MIASYIYTMGRSTTCLRCLRNLDHTTVSPVDDTLAYSIVGKLLLLDITHTDHLYLGMRLQKVLKASLTQHMLLLPLLLEKCCFILLF